MCVGQLAGTNAISRLLQFGVLQRIQLLVARGEKVCDERCQRDICYALEYVATMTHNELMSNNFDDDTDGTELDEDAAVIYIYYFLELIF